MKKTYKKGEYGQFDGKRRFSMSGKWIVAVCGIIAFFTVAVGIWFYNSSNEGDSKISESRSDTEENKDTSGEGNDTEEGGGIKDSDGVGDSTDSESAGDLSQQADKNSTFNLEVQEGIEGLTLPCTIPGSSLVIQGISSYDGTFIENGKDSDISGITVIILQNSGKTAVEYANITMEREGNELQFEVSAIPAGGTVVVQEKNQIPFQKGTYSDCRATVAELDGFEMSEDQVKVEESGEQSLIVTNLTDENIPAVRIFYKFYMEDEETYVGGITYTAKITDLVAGKSVTVTPSHYIKGSSKIMMIRTYDKAE